MFNYFYTIEVDMAHEVMKAEFGISVNNMFNKIIGIEFTSDTFTKEKDCVDSILAEVDRICNLLTDKHNLDALAVETYPNPFLMYDKNSKSITDLSEEEKIFWKPNKLALFAIFKNREEENFMIRYVIYCFEDPSYPKDDASINLLKAESPSKFLN